MKQVFVKLVATVVLSTLCLLIGSQATMAETLGLGVGPSVVTVKNAVAGAKSASHGIVTPSDKDQVYPLDGSGGIASWIAFHSMEDDKVTITNLSVPANGRGYANVKFTVPPIPRQRSMKDRYW